jgi:hypothetical protein
MRFSRRLFGYAFAAPVRYTTVNSALQTYGLEKRIQDYKNKWNKYVLKMDSYDRHIELRITNQLEEEGLKDRENDGRIVFATLKHTTLMISFAQSVLNPSIHLKLL